MSNYITEDSFGSLLPDDWQEIAAELNAVLESAGIPEYGELTTEQQYLVNLLWERMDQPLVHIDGKLFDYDAVVNLMDDDIREELSRQLAPCLRQVFVDSYLEEHEKKYHDSFVIN